MEGPADASTQLAALAASGVVPPVALLGYTQTAPLETVLYPFATYSPEMQAALWAARHARQLRFIDLPTGQLLGLRQAQKKSERQEDLESLAATNAGTRDHDDLYERLAAGFDERDYESFWERRFEHNLDGEAFMATLHTHTTAMRAIEADRECEAAPYEFSRNLVREAHMRREICRVLDAGTAPEKVVAVVGAYHHEGLKKHLPPMSDAELAALPGVPTRVTLMPYSYFRLSSRTGYGAGNLAPFYFERMWQLMQENRVHELPAEYLSLVARMQRGKGHNASSASIIEAVRLADALAGLRSGRPVLKDLHDAAVTCFGNGSLAPVAESLNMANIGTAIGSLPEGLGQTPIQEDMERELARLKLLQYKTGVELELTLDLRENYRVKSQEAAFLDLHRSTFLHRLEILGLHFARCGTVSQDAATWAEKWLLQWTPEVEIELVEAGLRGESIELATAWRLREALDECHDPGKAARLIRQACECRLEYIFDNALATLQRLLVDSEDFIAIGNAARELSLLTRYGDLRQFAVEPLKPILQQLFLRGSLLLGAAAVCDDKAAKEILEAVNTLELISQEQFELVDTDCWQREVAALACRDNCNTRLSGAAFALLLEHGLADEQDCAREVARRLSPGVPADLGAGWFEGLSGRNRYALLSRTALWRELDAYIMNMDDEAFTRAVVFLRRAFGAFEAPHKNSLAELLGEFWGIGAAQTAEVLQAEFTEDEQKKLDELSDFEFDF